MKRAAFIFLLCISALLFTATVSADAAPRLKASVSGDISESWRVTDAARYTKSVISGGDSFTISADGDIGALYFIWDAPAPEAITIESAGRVVESATGFIHDYIPLGFSAGELTVTIKGSGVLCDVYAYGAGEAPDGVQVWKKPDGPCDILFMPTHDDDDVLYMGAALAQAAAKENCVVQVAYMVNHNDEYYRPHELLNALWEMNVDRYPVIPDFPDVFSWSLEHAKTIYNEEDILWYQIDLIRRFQPQIIVGHDLKGEYGHGAHILNAVTLTRAVELAKASLLDPWDTPKLYLHLYKQNEIVLDCDTPLEAFGGATAYEMAQRGFAMHKSQTEFFKVERGGTYDFNRLGLYRSTVGADISNDIFEHITLRADMLPAEPPEPEPEKEQPDEAAGQEKLSTESAAAVLPAQQVKAEPVVPKGQNGIMDGIAAPSFELSPNAVLTALICAMTAAAISVLLFAALSYNRRR